MNWCTRALLRSFVCVDAGGWLSTAAWTILTEEIVVGQAIPSRYRIVTTKSAAETRFR